MAVHKMSTEVSQMKFAERLSILNDRTLGMLTRVYNMKKACGDVKSRPQFLSDKSFESAISLISKKFPSVDVKRNTGTFAVVDEMRNEVMKNLSLYYYTFVDLLDLKDNILHLLTNMDRHQCQLNITLNYELTSSFMNLVVNYIALMILLSRVEDRKVVLGLFNAAYTLAHNGSEASFPRLGQMIIDYESPLKKLCEDLGPLNRLIHSSLNSMREIYARRNITAEQQRESSLISLLSNPKQMVFAAQTHTMACEYLPLDVMDRWIIFGTTVCAIQGTLLNEQPSWNLFQRALQHGMALRLFRDEVILVFPMVLEVFEPIKGYSRRVQELKELQLLTMQTCTGLHAHRRQFLRAALRELLFLIRDQPGLLGPKILFVWMALSMARDEVLWLLCHINAWPLVQQLHKKGREAAHNNAPVDRQLPELLHYMSELRQLVRRHQQLISNYHIEYVAGYDQPMLDEMVHAMDHFKQLNEQYDQLLITSFLEGIANIRDDHLNLDGLRLDWFRFQANVSVLKSAFNLQRHTNFAICMNTTIFHLKMIDAVEEILRDTSELSIYCFFPHLFDGHMRECLYSATQARYVGAYAHLAGDFVHALHDMCPEERDHIVERGLVCCIRYLLQIISEIFSNSALEELATRTTEVLMQMCQEELQLAVNYSPEGCARIMALCYAPVANKNTSPPQDLKMPGHESMRSSRDAGSWATKADKTYLYLSELCYAIEAMKQLSISDHTLSPKEYLMEKLEQSLLSALSIYVKGAPNGGEVPRRPSEMLALIQVELLALQNIDTSLGIDITRLFNDALLQQSQVQDAHGQETLASVYFDWYVKTLLGRSSPQQKKTVSGHLIYSHHFQNFLNSQKQAPASIAWEEYTDRRELLALVQLVGPYGVKLITETIIWDVAGQIIEMYKLVREHQETLHAIRINFDKPERIRELVAALNQRGQQENQAGKHQAPPQVGVMGAVSGSPLEKILQHIIAIGESVAFRHLLSNALHDVLRQRIPFLMRTMHSLVDGCSELERVSIDEMTAATGLESAEVDFGIVNAMKSKAQTHNLNEPEDHYNLSCLLMVFIAVALPKLAASRHSSFRASFVATQSNLLTIPFAVNALSNLFFLHQRGDVRERMREFIGLVSSGLLKIIGRHTNGTKDAEQMPEYQSVYILLEKIVKHSPYLNYDVLESCFPYTLVGSSYLNCYRREAGLSAPT